MLLDRDPETKALRHTVAWNDLEIDLERFQPDVLFLDPLAELHAEDENANVALREVVAEFRSLARKHAIAVVLVHHTRKGPVTPGDMDAGRGASSIASACRVVLTVAPMQEEDTTAFGLRPEARKHYFWVDGGKANYSSLTACEWYERQVYTLANGDHVAVPIAWKPPADVVSLDSRRAIHDAVAAGSPVGPWSARLSNDARSIKRLLVEHGVVTGTGQRAAVDELSAAGFVTAEYRRANRGTGNGLRAPDGRPETVEWLKNAST